MTHKKKRRALFLCALIVIAVSTLVQYVVLRAQPESLRPMLYDVLALFTALAVVAAAIVCLVSDCIDRHGQLKQRRTLAACLISIVCLSQLTIGIVSLSSGILSEDQRAYTVASEWYAEHRTGLLGGDPIDKSTLPAEIESAQFMSTAQAAPYLTDNSACVFPSARGAVVVHFHEGARTSSILTTVLATLGSMIGISILSIELMQFFLFWLEGRHGRPDGAHAQGHSPFPYIRYMTFFFVFTAMLGKSFLPIWSSELAAGMPNAGFWTAMPQTVELLLVCVSIVGCAIMVERWGWKPAFILGVIVTSAGMLLTALSTSYFVFLAARAVFGAGYGLVWMTLRNMTVLTAATRRDRSVALALNAGIFAGMNFGVSLGSLLSGMMSNRQIFIMAACLAPVLIPFVLPMRNEKTEAEAPNPSPMRGRKFAAPRTLLLLLVLLVAPGCIATAFTGYYLPIQVVAIGGAITDVGALQLFYGVIIAYGGSAIADAVTKKGDTVLLNVAFSCLVGAALLIAPLGQSMGPLFLSTLLMSIADSFGYLEQARLFFASVGTQGISPVASMSALSVIKKLAETLGPVTFALCMSFPYGVCYMGIAIFVLAAAFVALTRRRISPGQEGAD